MRLRPMRRAALTTTAVTGLLVAFCGGAGIALVGALSNEQIAPPMTTLAGCGGQPVQLDGPVPLVGGLDEEQMRNAAIIVQVGQEMGMPPRAWVIAVATALQESSLRNLGHLGERNDHDSLGLFQQRPSQGWGTPEQIMDPRYASRKFYSKLREVEGWETMRLTDAAQAVQRSAFPDAYAKWEGLASEVVNALTGGAARAVGDTTGDTFECAGYGTIAASGWTVPAPGPVVSGFRTIDRPGHDGVDIAAERGTPIVAAAGGVVITVECNASTGNCDVDGSPSVQGCGWYAEILHADDVITRYCHMRSRPMVEVGQTVVAGQKIGEVGSSGNSSGPHLHFEVHINRDRSDGGAIDPQPFLAAKGARLQG